MKSVSNILFCGRTEELGTLKHWISAESSNKTIPCRLITLLGMSGIGKTWLSVKLAQQIQDRFEFVIWRSLLPAAPVKDLLDEKITKFQAIAFLDQKHQCQVAS
ncbi:hypothetical protein [Nostoc sp. CHAB 5836]|uniref:hypothetical protein n=1 Tax=Nostoc sp. CHAB 5836 TaxID=2780404 RepID=UPI0027952590|nr:hypothetical protein [Nostoc sp. CHAB 5836]